MKKFVIASLVILLAIFLIPWRVVSNENILDEMYLCLCMPHPSRYYTKADFSGFEKLHFPLWVPLTKSMGDSQHIPFEYEASTCWIKGVFWKNHTMGRQVDFLAYTEPRGKEYTSISLSYRVDTKEIRTKIHSDSSNSHSAQSRTQRVLHELLAFLEKWVALNGDRSRYSMEDFGNVLDSESGFAVPLRDYLLNLP